MKRSKITILLTAFVYLCIATSCGPTDAERAEAVETIGRLGRKLAFCSHIKHRMDSMHALRIEISKSIGANVARLNEIATIANDPWTPQAHHERQALFVEAKRLKHRTETLINKDDSLVALLNAMNDSIMVVMNSPKF